MREMKEKQNENSQEKEKENAGIYWNEIKSYLLVIAFI